MNACELCDGSGGEVLWQDECCRVVRVGDTEGAAFPGFCRVIWRAHVREMTDLATADRHYLMDVVAAVEHAVREVVRPDKINLASLGNVVPHLHWHVIPRWADDSHYPAPIWAAGVRPAPARGQPERLALVAALTARLGESQ